ncbi:MAG: GNAT family N-acetyltransferase [Anaerolineae bacterium]|nr:GNAT family N-acetyltransferase [Anaerolineae bacterium]
MTKTRDYVYTNTDAAYQEICDFLDALAPRDPYMLWESGRMNFWRHNVHGDKDPQAAFFRENVHLWRSDDEALVALFISEYGEDDFFVEVLPEYRHLYPDILRWVEDVWARTRSTIEIDVLSNGVEKIRRLKAHGFGFKCHFENWRTYDLDEVDLDYALPEGFRVVAFSDSPHYASRVALVRSAFNNPDYTETRLRGLMASPDYVDAYNLSVVSPAGRHVAYCIGWHERAHETAGYIEPVGTHADFRRRGFASAVIRECFRRMKANGVRTVEIASRAEPNVSNYLYDSLGPKTTREVHKYGKPVA